MTPKEKAAELVDKFIKPAKFVYSEIEWLEKYKDAKDCSLIAVDEILDKDGYNNDYWHEVKEEIENL
jgi:ribosome biogenesis protein Tsr3